jgi:microcystin degradation protein MlrC
MVFRAAYKGLFDEVIFVAAPGSANPHLTSLQWQYIPRPMYPFDPDMEWSPE